MPHVDEGTLHALLDGALRAEEPERARRVEAHLDACADCRARLEQAAELRDRAGDVLAGLDAEPAAPTPAFQEVLARAAAGPGVADGAARDRLRHQAGWTRGLAWAATIVVALGTGYLVRDLAGPTGAVPDRSRRERVEPAAADVVEQAEPDAITEGAAADQAPPDAARRAPIEAEAMAAPTAGAGESVASPEQAEAAEVESPGAPAVADLTVQKLVDADDTGTGWREAELDEAEARVGPILVLPDAEIARAEVAESGESLARTLQVLPGGIEVRVTQAAGQAAVGEPAEAGDEAVGEQEQLDAARAPAPAQPTRLRAEGAVAAAEEPAPAQSLLLRAEGVVVTGELRTVVLERDDLVLTLTGPLPGEVLQALAASAAPRQP